MDLVSDDSNSTDDLSVIDEATEHEIESALRAPLEYPAPCPVCFPCKYSFHNFKDYKALRQHALARGKDRSAQYIKVRHFHEALLHRLEDVQHDYHVQLAATTDTQTVISKSHVSEEVAMAVDNFHRMDEDLKKRTRMNSDLQAEIVHKKRELKRTNDRIEDVTNQLAMYRSQSEALVERSMKELEAQEQELRILNEEKSQMLAAHESAMAALRKRIARGPGAESRELSARLKQMTHECHRLQKEKEDMKKHLEERRKQKAQAEARIKDARRCAQAFERQAKALVEEVRQVEQEKEYEVTLDLFKTLGLEEPNLPVKCLRCQRRFQKSRDEESEDVCQRIIFDICNCADYCRDCFSTLEECPRHHCPVGEGVPFRTYG